MPDRIKETIGQAQKQLSSLESGARKLLTGTWQQIRDTKSLKAVEAALVSFKTRYGKVGQRAEDLSSAYSSKAFHTVGLVTQNDLRAIEGRLDRLSTDIKKLAPKRKSNNSSKETPVEKTKRAKKTPKKKADAPTKNQIA